MKKIVLGNHYLADFYNCNKDMLEDVDKIRNIMHDAGTIGKLNIVNECFHQFKPNGVSGVLVLKESHFTIHTWPEYNFASVDLYLCDKSVNVSKIVKYLSDKFETNNYDIKLIERGIKN